MDPASILTIASSALKLSKTAWDIGSAVVSFANSAKTVDQTIENFGLEIKSLGSSCALVNDRLKTVVQEHEQRRGSTRNFGQRTILWQSLDDQLSACQRTVYQIEEALGISIDVKGDMSLLEKIRRQFTLTWQDSKIADARERIRSHTACLQIVLLSINIEVSYLEPRRANQILQTVLSDLAAKIELLRKQVMPTADRVSEDILQAGNDVLNRGESFYEASIADGSIVGADEIRHWLDELNSDGASVHAFDLTTGPASESTLARTKHLKLSLGHSTEQDDTQEPYIFRTPVLKKGEVSTLHFRAPPSSMKVRQDHIDAIRFVPDSPITRAICRCDDKEAYRLADELRIANQPPVVGKIGRMFHRFKPIPVDRTDLQLAAYHGLTDVIEAFVDAGADVGLAINYAVRSGCVGTIEALCKAGLDLDMSQVDALLHQSKPPLVLATKLNDLPAIDVLMHYGAHGSTSCPGYGSAIHAAIAWSSNLVIEALSTGNAGITMRHKINPKEYGLASFDHRGSSLDIDAYGLAAALGRLEVVKYLSQRRIDTRRRYRWIVTSSRRTYVVELGEFSATTLAAIQGHLHILEWMKANKCLTDCEEALGGAIGNGQGHVAHWFITIVGISDIGYRHRQRLS